MAGLPAGVPAAHVGFLVFGSHGGPGEEPAAEGRVGNEADTELVQGREQHFDFTLEEGVLGLKNRDGLDGMGAAHSFRSGFTETEVRDLSGVDEFLHGSGDVLDGDAGVHPVLVEDVDVVHPEVAEAVVDDLADVLRPAVEPELSGEAELRRDDDIVAEVLHRVANDLLVLPQPYSSAVSKKVTPRS